MSAESTILAVLEADATLLALATGGIYSFDEAGSEGINRTLTPSAFDSNGIVKPCIMVSARNANPGYNVGDDSNQSMDVRQVVECWFFDHAAYSTIESMKDRVYTLLQAQRLSGPYRVDWAGDYRLPRDMDLDAFQERQDWLTIWIRSV